MPFRLAGSEGNRGAAGGNARLEIRLALRLVSVAAEPVAGARQFPGGLEVFRILREPRGPDGFGLLRVRDRLALPVERIGIFRLTTCASAAVVRRSFMRRRKPDTTYYGLSQ